MKLCWAGGAGGPAVRPHRATAAPTGRIHRFHGGKARMSHQFLHFITCQSTHYSLSLTLYSILLTALFAPYSSLFTLWSSLFTLLRVTEKPKAVILLSGGLDSATTLAIAISEGYSACALSFKYGQRHKMEIESSSKVAKALGASKHLTLEIDLTAIGGSALTDRITVPKNRDEKTIGSGIPVTYVPARNTIFLSFALAWAEVLEAQDIFIGVNALDYSGYPDC